MGSETLSGGEEGARWSGCHAQDALLGAWTTTNYLRVRVGGRVRGTVWPGQAGCRGASGVEWLGVRQRTLAGPMGQSPQPPPPWLILGPPPPTTFQYALHAAHQPTPDVHHVLILHAHTQASCAHPAHTHTHTHTQAHTSHALTEQVAAFQRPPVTDRATTPYTQNTR